MKDLSNENIIHKLKNGIEYLQFRRLLEFPEIKHMYVLKNENMTFELKDNNKQKLINTYKKVCDLENMDYTCVVKPHQMHTDQVKYIYEKILVNEPDICIEELNYTDGLITNQKNIVLSTTNADCILLIMYDIKNKVIANIHSGWKGTFQKIAYKTVQKMKMEYGTNPKDIICCMSPSIAKCCFEVEEDVKSKCEEMFTYTGKIQEIIKNSGYKNGVKKYHIDTILINQIILQEIGVLKENIIQSNICSLCNHQQIHSRRAEGEHYGVDTMLISL